MQKTGKPAGRGITPAAPCPEAACHKNLQAVTCPEIFYFRACKLNTGTPGINSRLNKAPDIDRMDQHLIVRPYQAARAFPAAYRRMQQIPGYNQT